MFFCCPGLETPQLLLAFFSTSWVYFFYYGKRLIAKHIHCMFCRLIKIFFLVYPNGKNNSWSNPKIFSYLQIFCYLNVCHNRKNSFCSSSWLRKIHILIQSSCKLDGTPKFVLSRPPLMHWFPTTPGFSTLGLFAL